MRLRLGVSRSGLCLACLSACAWTFLWTYLRKSLYTTAYAELPLGDGSWTYLLVVCLTVALALVACACRRPFDRLVDAPIAVVAFAAAGTACMAAMGWGLRGVSVGTLATGLTCVCLLVWAASFCVVFFAWVRLLCRLSFELGLEVVVICVLFAAFASFLLTVNTSDGSLRLELMNVAGLAVAGLCFAVARRIEGSGADRRERPAGPGESDGLGRTLPWLALCGVAFLVVGLLGYAHYFDDGFEGLSPWELAVDVLTFVVLGVMAAFSIYANRTTAGRRRMPITLVFAVVLGAFFVYFVVAVSFSTESALLYGLARLIRRISRVAAFLTVLVMAYQYALPPTSAFTLAFLIPSLLPKPIQMTLASADLGLAGTSGQGYALVALMTTGFFLTVCLVVFCLLNMDGRLARSLVGEEVWGGHEPGSGGTGLGLGGGPGAGLSAGLGAGLGVAGPAGMAGTLGAAPTSAAAGSAAGARRRDVCEAIGSETGLTHREVDVLELFSRGASAQEAALALCISTNTVNTHAMTLYRKLDVHSKRELVEMVGARLGEEGAVFRA